MRRPTETCEREIKRRQRPVSAYARMHTVGRISSAHDREDHVVHGATEE